MPPTLSIAWHGQRQLCSYTSVIYLDIDSVYKSLLKISKYPTPQNRISWFCPDTSLGQCLLSFLSLLSPLASIVLRTLLNSSYPSSGGRRGGSGTNLSRVRAGTYIQSKSRSTPLSLDIRINSRPISHNRKIGTNPDWSLSRNFKTHLSLFLGDSQQSRSGLIFANLVYCCFKD